MSVLDKALAAITPAPSAERRKQATEDARAAAVPGGWLAMALDHHDEIRLGFRKGGSAATPTERSQAMRALALILNGHSQAEEVVLYPAMAQHRHKSQAGSPTLSRPPSRCRWRNSRTFRRQSPNGSTNGLI